MRRRSRGDCAVAWEGRGRVDSRLQDRRAAHRVAPNVPATDAHGRLGGQTTRVGLQGEGKLGAAHRTDGGTRAEAEEQAKQQLDQGKMGSRFVDR
ncbi:hypothetical protein BRADI_2g27662v3 [Brachypodium distachyon]|uniref:Uncharacterized protein n=1 Tax=Brachypodium distachyon TaxID=15368 RepID=A0A2K2DAY4_BRADI|nr:hypothetical protein BRADI_2g27662v3 [Brachypodium distachyon]